MNESDEELMSLYAKGSSDAFEALYGRYENRLMSFFRRRLGAKGAAALTDMFQVTWLKVHQSRARFDRNQKFASWIFTIAINSLRDFSRESNPLKGAAPLNENDVQAGPAFLDALTAQELKDLEHDLQQLPVEWRDVLLLADWEGFASKEIAEMKKLKEDNIRQILSRARKALKASGHGRS